MAILPLVCAAFRRVLTGPSATVWPSITYEGDLAAPNAALGAAPAPPPASLDRARCFLRWLRTHGGLSRTLQLDFWAGGQPPVASPELEALGESLEDTLGGEEGRAQGLCVCRF